MWFDMQYIYCGSTNTVCSCSYNLLHGFFTSNIPSHCVGIGIQSSGLSPLPPNWRKIWRGSPRRRWTTGESERDLTRRASIWLCTSSIYQRKSTLLCNALASFPDHMGTRLVMLQSCSHSVCIMQNFVQKLAGSGTLRLRKLRSVPRTPVCSCQEQWSWLV